MPTALIVEDDPDQAEMAARFLRYRDFETDIAGTGGDGLSKARAMKPDLILLDLMLPDTTGFDVCRGLRTDRETMLTPVVMVTALGDEVNEAARIEACATGGLALASKALVERLDPGDAAALDLDPDHITYTALADLDGATEKARRDAPAIAVCEI